ncbi:hypothetical protein GCM10022254_06610 [Actinomadura meridiana]|uniref:Uncharacterized protein n=1 Tax=Actinomadura meridiana TaxID=559626 RepID=A0ABP8BTN0_9ACTN
MGAARQVKVARWSGAMRWWRVRHGHATAEWYLDVLAHAMRERGWSHLKVYVESPPAVWVFCKGAEDAALCVTAKRVGGRWVYQVWPSIHYPCYAAVQVANVLDDVLRDRMDRTKPRAGVR